MPDRAATTRAQAPTKKMLETGQYATIKEIGKAERINPSYVSRVLRLTLLAPATVQAISEGRADAAPTLAEAMVPFPVVDEASGQPLPPIIDVSQYARR